MNNLTNFFKNHRKAIIIPTISLITIAIIILFTTVTLSHFKNITENENDILTLSATELAGNIVVSSDDFLFVVASEVGEKTEEEQAEDDQQDKEEEKKAEEEAKKQEEQEKSKEKTSTKTSAPASYYIKINRYANTITVYTTDANGNYTVPVKSMVCSTGYASPTGGVYSTKKIGTWHTLFGGVYGQYCTQITGNILFHSVPYLRRGDNASLEYWAYDKLGTTASAGCVRLTTADAQWIYYNCNNGTKVEFYSSATPGPLGKPTATKISAESSPYKNWDPTDPNPNNPWKNKQPSAQETYQTKTNDTIKNIQSSNNNSNVTVTSIENTTKQENKSSNQINTSDTTNNANTTSSNKTDTAVNTTNNTTSKNSSNISNTTTNTTPSNTNLSNTNTSSNTNTNIKNNANSNNSENKTNIPDNSTNLD